MSLYQLGGKRYFLEKVDTFYHHTAYIVILPSSTAVSLLCFGVKLYLGPHMGPAPSLLHVVVIFCCQNMATAHRGLWSSTWGHTGTLPQEKIILLVISTISCSREGRYYGFRSHYKFLLLFELTFIPYPFFVQLQYHTSCINVDAWMD